MTTMVIDYVLNSRAVVVQEVTVAAVVTIAVEVKVEATVAR